MTLETMKALLEGISGMTNKVAYYAFPEGEAPALPFICFLSPSATNFSADGIVYHSVPDIQVELYTKDRDLTLEGKIEAAFQDAELYWEKESIYLDDEKCFETVYSL